MAGGAMLTGLSRGEARGRGGGQFGRCEVCGEPATGLVFDEQEIGRIADGYVRTATAASHAFCDRHPRPPLVYRLDGQVQFRRPYAPLDVRASEVIGRYLDTAEFPDVIVGNVATVGARRSIVITGRVVPGVWPPCVRPPVAGGERL